MKIRRRSEGCETVLKITSHLIGKSAAQHLDTMSDTPHDTVQLPPVAER